MTLYWKIGARRSIAKATLLLDSGATGPVLSTSWMKQTQMPCVRCKVPCPISDASRNNILGSGLHYTKEVKLKIGDHSNKMRFEVADIHNSKIDGYLPMSWL